MIKRLFPLLLIALFIGLNAKKVNAQASSTNPQLYMYRHNGSAGGSPLPAVTGNTLGTLEWRALTAIHSVKLGATIRSQATLVAPGVLHANLFLATSDATGLKDKVVITPEGLVGIGELNPTFFNLHVKGNTHTTGRFHGRVHFDVGEPTGNPSTYNDEAYFEQKPRSILGAGLPLNPAYPIGGILSLAPGSGSLDRQLFSGGNDGLWTRSEAPVPPGAPDSWLAWQKLLTSEDIMGRPNLVARFLPPDSPSSRLGDSQLFDDGTGHVVLGGIPAGPNPIPAFLPANFLTIHGQTFVDGRLGVGNNAPAEALEITGNGKLSGNLGLGLAALTAPAYRLDVNGDSHLGGSVGINTVPNADPQVRLDVNGRSQLFGNVGINVLPDANFGLDVDGDANFRDRVKIGANAFPTFAGSGIYELAVGGGIIAEQVLVKLQTGWPDYVFEKGRELQPLAEVAAFIEEENHLPGVPSATEVSENGLNLGEMQKTQMEKIEELYLHLIALSQKVEDQQKTIERLQTEMNTLKNQPHEKK